MEKLQKLWHTGMTFQSKEDLFSMNDHLQILKQNKKKNPRF